jgi:hypothetical protein
MWVANPSPYETFIHYTLPVLTGAQEKRIMANTKPSATVRIGSIKAAIWANDNSGGRRHSVTFERLYKDGEQWKSTRSFGRDDLLVLAKVADLAYSRILELQEQPESA